MDNFTLGALIFSFGGAAIIMFILFKIGLFKSHRTEIQTSVEIIKWPAAEHKDKDYLVREHTMVYDFNIGGPMKFPWLYNLARFKTKKEAEKFKKTVESNGRKQAVDELNKLKAFSETTLMLRGARNV